MVFLFWKKIGNGKKILIEKLGWQNLIPIIMQFHKKTKREIEALIDEVCRKIACLFIFINDIVLIFFPSLSLITKIILEQLNFSRYHWGTSRASRLNYTNWDPLVAVVVMSFEFRETEGEEFLCFLFLKKVDLLLIFDPTKFF